MPISMPVLWPRGHNAACSYISGPPPEKFQHAFPRRLAILGSTGSIGRNAMALIRQNPDKFQIKALACAKNARLLTEQAIIHRPPLLAVLNKKIREDLWNALPEGYSPEILTGQEGYARLAAEPELDMILSAQAGAAGLAATLAAALSGHVIALANKESLVLAGRLVRNICARTGASILPVDSEHFALFECLRGRSEYAEELLLTASGGPFRQLDIEDFTKITPEQALNHPKWKMGPKITIDSATLMNKGLEIIEAMHLFGTPASKIRVLIHPQAIVHSLVRFRDNALLAQMAVPDMKLPIASCFNWPQMPVQPVDPLDLASIGNLSFYPPDHAKFPALNLAAKIAQAECRISGYGLGKMCIVMNGANEEAVSLFIDNKIPFSKIAKIVEYAINHLSPEPENILCEDLTDLPPLAQALAISERAKEHDLLARDYVRFACERQF